VYADAMQTMWRPERPFVLPAGGACVPVPAWAGTPVDGVRADQHDTPGMAPG
jgi:hypothetical protein